jgi:hypothetical protein
VTDLNTKAVTKIRMPSQQNACSLFTIMTILNAAQCAQYTKPEWLQVLLGEASEELFQNRLLADERFQLSFNDSAKSLEPFSIAELSTTQSANLLRNIFGITASILDETTTKKIPTSIKRAIENSNEHIPIDVFEIFLQNIPEFTVRFKTAILDIAPDSKISADFDALFDIKSAKHAEEMQKLESFLNGKSNLEKGLVLGLFQTLPEGPITSSLNDYLQKSVQLPKASEEDMNSVLKLFPATSPENPESSAKPRDRSTEQTRRSEMTGGETS